MRGERLGCECVLVSVSDMEPDVDEEADELVRLRLAIGRSGVSGRSPMLCLQALADLGTIKADMIVG